MSADPVRDALRTLLRRTGHTMKSASLAIGRNETYLYQYLTRGMPKVLKQRDAEALAQLLHCNVEAIRHRGERPAQEIPAGTAPPPDARVAAVPELDVDAGAGLTVFNDEYPVSTHRWYLPLGLIREAGPVNPDDLRIVRVRGDSMEPALSAGDRLVIDTGRRIPETGQLCVLFDGNGLVAKRVEYVPGSSPPTLRLISDNPRYAPYTCLAQEAHVVGRVLWSVHTVA